MKDAIGVHNEAVRRGDSVTSEEKRREIGARLANEENRANPRDERQHHALMKYEKLLGDIGTEIDNLMGVLHKVVGHTPQLHKAVGHLLNALNTFKLSTRDERALTTLKVEFHAAVSEASSIKDPLTARIWHSVVVAFKSFLNFLDRAQALLIGVS